MAKILLVEDEETLREVVTFNVRNAGHDIVETDNANDALMHLESFLPDLILLDMSLPVVDGWDAAKALKTNDTTKAIPIIALTAHAMAGDKEKAIQAGCDDYDTKPVDLARLLEKIEQWINA